jgi:hypothetical protein
VEAAGLSFGCIYCNRLNTLLLFWLAWADWVRRMYLACSIMFLAISVSRMVDSEACVFSLAVRDGEVKKNFFNFF